MIIKKLFIALFLMQAGFGLQAQKKDTINASANGNFVVTDAGDTLSLLDEASNTLRALKSGAVVVRLKTSPKSVAAYRAAGQNNVADRIEGDRRKQNEKIYNAFKRSFLFCKVYFIYSQDTRAFTEGNRKIFLNMVLQPDSTYGLGYDKSVVFNYNDNYVFCEFGSPESFSEFQNQPSYNGSRGTERPLSAESVQTSTAPATSSGLFFSDKNLKQLQRPFPFVEGVYMENYDAPVSSLSRQLDRTYYRLVEKRDIKAELKKEKKRLKAEQKKQPKYNPFK